MKKRKIIPTLLLLLMLMPQVAHANMAAPKNADIGSSITFAQNDALAVLSEVLDIRVNGAYADITATYHMKNTTGKTVTTSAMFLSPNILNGNVSVTIDEKELPFTVESYALSWKTAVAAQDWQYAVLEDRAADDDRQTVDSITFEMEFGPGQECDVVVSYTYALGGYPNLDFNARMGRIQYLLTPAAMWNGFEDLTINLYLDDDMPVVKESSLDFEKVSRGVYRYTSDTLPEEDLTVTIDETWFQNIFSTLRSPYLMMTLPLFAPVILLVLVVIVIIVWRVRKKKKQKTA